MLFPDIDIAGGTITFPIWLSALLAGLLPLLLLVIYRGRAPGAVTNLAGSTVRVGLILSAVVTAWVLLDRLAERDRAEERRALAQRMTEIGARAIAPGSPLGCFEPSLAGGMEGPCERAVFAGPETVAAAVAYVAGSLSLLADAVANGLDAEYDAAVAALRRRLEIDRFGLVAQVLAGEGCSADKCDRFAVFSDARRVSANLKARTFEALLARNSVAWPQPAAPSAAAPPAVPVAPVAAAPTPPPSPLNPSASVGINFPSAASIPPVSIMTNEPNEPPGQAGPPPPSAAVQKRPPGAGGRPTARATAGSAAAPAAPAAAPASPPIQIGPPAANAGTDPPPH